MGLDTVELVMEVEESFGITIPVDDAQQIITVGDLFEFIKSNIELAPAGICLSAATFYDLRKGLRATGVEQRFGPSTQLSDILPVSNRRSLWATLARNTKLRLPNLVRPPWIVASNITVTTCVSIPIALLASSGELTGFTFFATAIASFFATGFLTSVATSPFATKFNIDWGTFRGLSERVLAMNAAKQKAAHGPMGQDDIWIILREIIVAQLGVDAYEVTPKASFVKDLGCD